jgi:hypothetical protein
MERFEMAKKAKTTKKSRKVARKDVRRSPIPKKSAAKPAASKVAVRNSAIPRKAKAAKPAAAVLAAAPAQVLTHEMIAMRAFNIHCSGTGGDDFYNWCRAESELRHELGL